MKLTFEFVEAVPVEVWNKHDANNTLVAFVEGCGLRAVNEAVTRGYTKPISNINIEIYPDFNEPPVEHKVKTVIEYGVLV